MIYKPAERFTLVFYDELKRAKTFEIHKGAMRFFMMVILAFVLLALLAFIVPLVLYRGNELFLQTKVQQLGKQMVSQQGALSQREDQLQQEITQLREKLRKASVNLAASGRAKDELGLNVPLIMPVLGAKNLTAQSPLTIQDVRQVVRGGSIDFTFNIINDRAQKVSGHIFVLFRQANGVQYHGDQQNLVKSKGRYQLSYDMGEPFSAARYRPVQAHFTLLPESAAKRTYSFLILIFSRDGDLLLKQSVDSTQA